MRHEYSFLINELSKLTNTRIFTMIQNTLLSQLDSFKENFANNVPIETRQIMQDATDVLESSAITKIALTKGDLITNFTLSNQTGKSVELHDLLVNGPVVVSFYRGAWCPFCNLELKALQEHLADFQAQGASLLAISPQAPDSTLSTVEKNELSFDVLSDQNNKIAKKFGLVFTLPESLKPIYESFGIDIVTSNKEDSFELPFAATFVIDQSGVIQYAFVDADYTNRAEPQIIIDVLKSL